MSYSQFAATTQFYLHGRKHFNQTGYLKHAKDYKDFDLGGVDLTGKVYIVTGSNSGIGKEIAKYVAKQGATLYMACRSVDRANKARDEIIEESKNDKVEVLQVDCSLESSVRACWEEFMKRQGDNPRLDGLVCNAGVLLNEKTLTPEGIEVTFACHFLFGSYLLGSLALPLLNSTKGRIVFLTSAGMLNTKFPGFEIAASLKGKYNGNLAYAYAKRGQVLLAERWAALNPDIKVVSSHPGWTLTPAVDAAYGDQKKYLEPMRTPWQGAEGTAWLLACPAEEIESGAFYLDRKPQVKHMAGPFFSEGSFTKNTPEEVEEMMKSLADWTSDRRPTASQLVELNEAKMVSEDIRKAGKCTASEQPIEIQRFMGKWYVVAHIPTYFDKGTVDNTEEYVWDAEKQTIGITFTYSNAKRTKTSTINQTGKIKNEQNTQWQLTLKVAFVPISLPYLILDCAEDYSTCIVGDPKRSFLYIMARTPTVPEAVLTSLRAKSLRLGYNVDPLVKVPQKDAESS